MSRPLKINTAVFSQCAVSAWTFRECGQRRLFVAELSVGSAPVPIRAGVDMDVNGTSRINVDLLVEAGDGGGGALVPGGCSRASLVFFYCLGDVGEAARWYFFSAGG